MNAVHPYRDPSTVPDGIRRSCEQGHCDGACETHEGPVRPAFVTDWGWFAYCDTAFAEDRSRGLTVTEHPQGA